MIIMIIKLPPGSRAVDVKGGRPPSRLGAPKARVWAAAHPQNCIETWDNLVTYKVRGSDRRIQKTAQ
jgi:hypothetical protein